MTRTWTRVTSGHRDSPVIAATAKSQNFLGKLSHAEYLKFLGNIKSCLAPVLSSGVMILSKPAKNMMFVELRIFAHACRVNPETVVDVACERCLRLLYSPATAASQKLNVMARYLASLSIDCFGNER